MTNPPVFTVEPTATAGMSLFRWQVSAQLPQVIVLPTDIAEHLAGRARDNAALTATVKDLLPAAEIGASESGLSWASDAVEEARKRFPRA